MRIKNRARSFMQIRSSRSRSKRGVSPVIGVILMVAATIVIAGVVMAMLGGFGPPSKTYSVMATASERDVNGTVTVFVTYTGGPDAAMVEALTATINGISDQEWDKPPTTGTGWNETSPDGSPASVGTGGSCSSKCSIHRGPNNDHVIVSATFKDGTTQVILDTYV